MKRTTDGARRRGAIGKTGGSRGRFGFTLVELLTVIAIIGMLGAISITTVRASIQSAKETQTRTTIAKIDNVLTACYEKYQYRRVDLASLVPPGTVDNRWTNNPEIRARYRLMILRDLLRCDFPCVPEELGQQSQYNGTSSAPTTPLQQALITAAGGNLSSFDFEDENYPDNTFSTNGGGYPHVANAELLYLVVMNADPESRGAFSEREIADVDGNGLYEFVDGWGKPICWMRWAPGLESSDRQPLEADMIDKLTADEYLDSEDADPFDPMNVGVLNASGGVERGWFLVPYVFSAGPDERYGLTMPNPADVAEMNDPFIRGGSTLNVGAPYARTHKDNIDNHTLVR